MSRQPGADEQHRTAYRRTGSGLLARPRPRSGVGVLAVAGSLPERVGVHATTALIIASLVISPLFDGVAVAVFALVLGGMTLVRVLAVPAVLQVLLGGVLLVAAWSAALLLYEQVWWLDIVVHLGLNGVIAAAAGVLLHRGRLVPSGIERRGRWGIALTTTTVGVSLGVVWELAEWVGHEFVDSTIYIAPGDTMGDLVAGATGSAVAGLLLARLAGRER